MIYFMVYDTIKSTDNLPKWIDEGERHQKQFLLQQIKLKILNKISVRNLWKKIWPTATETCKNVNNFWKSCLNFMKGLYN